MNKFEEMQKEILSQYPKLPWYAFFARDYVEHLLTKTEGSNTFSQTFVVATYKRKKHLVRFGYLK